MNKGYGGTAWNELETPIGSEDFARSCISSERGVRLRNSVSSRETISSTSFTIFLDEFDFLENDLVGLICHAPQISNPFHFVELFYPAMIRHKLPLDTYPRSESVRDRIQRIIGIVDALHDKQRKGNTIDFPNVNQF